MSIQAIPYPMFQPAMRLISAITNDSPALVTTTFDHQYITGTIVRLYVPLIYGMTQANLKEGVIEVTSPTQFLISINTLNFDPFVIPTPDPGRLPGGELTQYAQVVPVGEINSILTASTQNVLPYP